MTYNLHGDLAEARARAALGQLAHVVELDEPEREFLAALLQREADSLAARTDREQKRFILGLRERIRPAYSRERSR